MKTSCPGCGAQVEIPSTAQSALCPYCGTTVERHATPKTAPAPANHDIHVFPFLIDKDQAFTAMLNQLVAMEGVPPELFAAMENVEIKRMLLPMYLMRGRLDVRWTATSVFFNTFNERTRHGYVQTLRNETFNAIGGNTPGGFELLLPAADSDTLPPQMIDYLCRPTFHTEAMIKAGEEYLQEQAGDGVEVRQRDFSEGACWQSPLAIDQINSVGSALAQKDAARLAQGHEIRNFTWNQTPTLDQVTPCWLSMYYISFTYNGQSYGACVDGTDGVVFLTAPRVDLREIELKKRSAKYTRRAWAYTAAEVALFVLFFLLTGLCNVNDNDDVFIIALIALLVLPIVTIVNAFQIGGTRYANSQLCGYVEQLQRHRAATAAFPQYAPLLVMPYGPQAQEKINERDKRTSHRETVVRVLVIITLLLALTPLALSRSKSSSYAYEDECCDTLLVKEIESVCADTVWTDDPYYN